MKIAGIGKAVPDKRSENTELEQRLNLEEGWILRRTGVRLRPVASPDETTSDLAVRAANAAIDDARIDRSEIALVLLATSTPDYPLPPTAPQVAYRLGLVNAGALDISGACAGFLYALALAESYGRMFNKPILIIGANVLSRRVNPQDAATISLFADGAGAMILVPGDSILGIYLGANGEHWDEIVIEVGGSRKPISMESITDGQHFMKMRNGPELFRHAVRHMAQAGINALDAAGLNIEDIDLWIPHQANSRIIREAGKLLGIAREKTMDITEFYGNSSSASIPIAMCIACENGLLKAGDTLLLTAVGAGLLMAGVVLRW